MAYSYKSLGAINGLPIVHAEITGQDYFPAYSRFEGYPYRRVERELSIVVSADSVSEDARCAKVRALWHANSWGGFFGMGNPFASGFLTLGPDQYCPYCGDYNPAGTSHCWRCGGERQTGPLLKVGHLPMVLTASSINLELASRAAIKLDFLIYGDIDYQDLHNFLYAPTNIVSTGYVPSEPRTYLCEWCGMVALEGEVCPGCGGTRLPWNEVLQLKRTCLYCGGAVEGGIVCDNCGARLSAELTVKDVMKGRNSHGTNTARC